MTGPLAVELLGAAGALLVLWAVVIPRRQVHRDVVRRRHLQARRARSLRLVLVGAAVAVLAGAVALTVTAVPAVALVAAVACAPVPMLIAQRRLRRERAARAAAWPEAVDVLVSAVRAGMSLPQALADLADRGPVALRAVLAPMAVDLRSGVAVAAAVQRLADNTGDQVAGRIAVVVRLVDEVGGASVGTVLRALAASLRADVQGRADIAARQSWTVVSGRVALAAPWLTLVALCLRPQVASAYRSTTGVVVVLGVAVLSAVAYACMRRIARLPAEVAL